MLIRTITMETSDDLLFSKESPLLPAAAELAFHTVNCSALNAEELRRENGLEVIGTGLGLILRHIKWFLTVQNLSAQMHWVQLFLFLYFTR